MNRKFHSQSNKGYMQIDFAIAILIFFSIFFVIFNMIENHKTITQKTFSAHEIHSDARDICFMLTRTSGIPNNWENNISTLQFAGMKNQILNFLENSKLSAFTFDNYFAIIDSMGHNGNIYIRINGLSSNTLYLDFGYPIENSAKTFSEFSCYSNYNLEVVKVFVEVWK